METTTAKQNKVTGNTKTSSLLTLNKRSYTMKHTSIFRRGMSALVALVLLVGLSFGQNLVIGSNTVTVGGNGTINVKGNIVNTGVTTAVNVGGTSSTVNLNGSSAQTIGGGSGALNFATLRATAASTKSITTDATVATALSVTSGGATQVEVAAAKTLTIAGTIASGGGATAPYKFDNATSVVDYSGGASQAMWGTTYNALNMSGAGGFTMQGNITVSNTVNHTGGALTVDNNFTAITGYTFGTISNVAAGKSLTLGTIGGSIATLSDITATGQLINGSGALTIATLTNNHGTITASANNGAISFTNAATNNGDITGGLGAVTFANTLSHATGTISSSVGTVLFSGAPSMASGTISAGTGGTLDFNAAVNGTGGTIALTGSGVANFAETFTAVPTLSFGGTSTVNFDGTSQNVPAATYVNLNMIGVGTKTALGTIAATNFDNGGSGNTATITDMGTQTLTISTGKENTNGTILFGGAANGVLFATGTVNYNAASGTQTIAGSGTYSTLLLTVGGTKQIPATTTVGTAAGLTVASSVTLDLAASDSQLDVAGDLTVNGFLTNAGTINVGP